MSRQVDENYFLIDEDDTGSNYDPNDGPVERLRKGSNNVTGAHGLANYEDISYVLDELDDKNLWIQKAKALFFDLQFCTDALKKEIREIIKEAGGYNPDVESSKTELRWKK